jgi:hypothetical protein
MKTHIPSRLSDDELIAEVKRLAGCEREATVDLARLFPQPEIAPSIRKLPARRPTAEPPAARARAGPAVGGGAPAAAAQEFRTLAPWSPPSPALFAPAPAAPSRDRPVVTPLALDRYQITFTASAETREKLQLAQDLLRHTIPSGDMAHRPGADGPARGPGPPEVGGDRPPARQPQHGQGIPRHPPPA